MVLRNGTAPFAALARGVSQAGESFAPGPLVHVVEELAAEPGGVRRRHRANDAASIDDLREQAEAGAAEVLADVANHERIAQVGFVAAVLQHGIPKGNAGIFAGAGD